MRMEGDGDVGAIEAASRRLGNQRRRSEPDARARIRPRGDRSPTPHGHIHHGPLTKRRYGGWIDHVRPQDAGSDVVLEPGDETYPGVSTYDKVGLILTLLSTI